ncbi:hypothetical protein PR048_029773 [Dryococelus australis]|uniref:PiggyBac transposable element-derived protein domain-containing protein n=1 Tax=Dryococelus australis TaxID=614101 RepID=A0ABQ9G9V3_9NEOP|nr:hypothetical protein PR048_029773 [Dryococelus australis]
MNSVTTRGLFDKHTGTMSLARFEFLTNSSRFDDRESRSECRKNDRLAVIREVFHHVTTSQKLYVPSEYCTADEQLLGIHGRCVLKMFIPSKFDKYIIKILMMCDAKTFYMLNAQVFTGKDSTPKGIPVAQYYSTEMSKPIHDTNWNLTFDNWFTSVSLAKKLLSKHSATMVGKMKSNKPEMSSLFKEIRGRKRNSEMFAFSGEETLLSYCPPKKKKMFITILSTMHDRKDEDKTVRIPEIIEIHNATKGSTQDPKFVPNLLAAITGIPGIPVQETLHIQKNTNSGRFAFCIRSIDRKSRTSCETCNKFICAEHKIKICPGCVSEGRLTK